MDTIRYELADGIATLTLDESGSPVKHNVRAVAAGPDRGGAAGHGRSRRGSAASCWPRPRATFFAGADLKGHDAAEAGGRPARVPRDRAGQEDFRALETLGVPVGRLLNGSALGGGWEVALAAHHRVAVDDPKIQFGLPEITLG